MDKLQINVALQIQKPPSVVFEAIVNPQHMSGYFISYGSGRMVQGAELIWRFPEFEGDAPVRVGTVIEGKQITFSWDIDRQEMEVNINLSHVGNDDTIVRITEREMENSSAGIEWLKGNTEGWANFLCCLKAYLEYGINLRKGGFDFRANT
jgi:uncharacterized protein YndB with AHSA1/START domain